MAATKRDGGTGGKTYPVIPVIKARLAAQESIKKGTRPVQSKGRVPGRAVGKATHPPKTYDQWYNAYKVDVDTWINNGADKKPGKWGGGPMPKTFVPKQPGPTRGFGTTDSPVAKPPPKGFKKKVIG